jgi:hypothetical protein
MQSTIDAVLRHSMAAIVDRPCSTAIPATCGA